MFFGIVIIFWFMKKDLKTSKILVLTLCVFSLFGVVIAAGTGHMGPLLNNILLQENILITRIGAWTTGIVINNKEFKIDKFTIPEDGTFFKTSNLPDSPDVLVNCQTTRYNENFLFYKCQGQNKESAWHRDKLENLFCPMLTNSNDQYKKIRWQSLIFTSGTATTRKNQVMAKKGNKKFTLSPIQCLIVGAQLHTQFKMINEIQEIMNNLDHSKKNILSSLFDLNKYTRQLSLSELMERLKAIKNLNSMGASDIDLILNFENLVNNLLVFSSIKHDCNTQRSWHNINMYWTSQTKNVKILRAKTENSDSWNQIDPHYSMYDYTNYILMTKAQLTGGIDFMKAVVIQQNIIVTLNDKRFNMEDLLPKGTHPDQLFSLQKTLQYMNDLENYINNFEDSPEISQELDMTQFKLCKHGCSKDLIASGDWENIIKSKFFFL